MGGAAAGGGGARVRGARRVRPQLHQGLLRAPRAARRLQAPGAPHFPISTLLPIYVASTIFNILLEII